MLAKATRFIVHPAQGARDEKGRRGATAFCREAGELVDLAGLTWRLVAARRAEPEPPGNEPGAPSRRPNRAGRINPNGLGRERSPIRSQPRPARSYLDPFLGMI